MQRKTFATFYDFSQIVYFLHHRMHGLGQYPIRKHLFQTGPRLEIFIIRGINRNFKLWMNTLPKFLSFKPVDASPKHLFLQSPWVVAYPKKTRGAIALTLPTLTMTGCFLDPKKVFYIIPSLFVLGKAIALNPFFENYCYPVN